MTLDSRHIARIIIDMVASPIFWTMHLVRNIPVDNQSADILETESEIGYILDIGVIRPCLIDVPVIIQHPMQVEATQAIPDISHIVVNGFDERVVAGLENLLSNGVVDQT